MSLKINRSNFKDRIIDNVAKAIKGIQEIQIYHTADDPVVLTCNDRPARKLLEHLDHVFLHGLRHITNGYWKIVSEFSNKSTVREINRLIKVATDLGKGRAWLSIALNEGLMESYFRCFESNLKLVKKYYIKDALVIDQQRLNVLLTLISGIELVVFQLDYDVPYLDLGMVPPYTRNRAESEESESDRLSLCSMDSTTSTASKNQVVSRDSPITVDDHKIPNGYLNQIDENVETKFDRFDSIIQEHVEPEDTSIEVIHVRRGSGKTKKHKSKKTKKDLQIKFVEDKEQKTSDTEEKDSGNHSNVVTPDAEHQYQKIDNLDKDVKPFYKLTHDVRQEELTSPTDESSNSEKVLRTSISSEKDFIYEKSFDISEKSDSDDNFIEDDYVQGYNPDKKCDIDQDSEFSENVIKKFQNKHNVRLSRNDDSLDEILSRIDDNTNVDSSICNNNNTHKSAIDKQNGVDETDEEEKHSEKYDESAIKMASDKLPVLTKDENNTVQSTKSRSDTENSTENIYNPVQSTNEESSTSKMQDLVDSLINQSDVLLKHHMYEEEPEDTNLEDSLSKSQQLCEGEIKLDNNTLLYLMLDVFDNSEEQFVKVFATTQGHTDGDCTPVFVTVTDRAIYFLSQKQSDHRFYKDNSIPFTSVDYISLGVFSQTLHIVCTNRRNQYWITTGNKELTNAIIDCITTTCNQSGVTPITVLTDATTQKIALKKYISKECSNDQEPLTCCYSLVHWDTPSIKGDNSEKLHREGHLLYKLHEPPGGFIGSQILQNPVSLIYGQSWKPAYVVLKDGLLCIYNDKNDSKPVLFVQVGGEECTGCRRATDTDRDHCIQIIKSDGSSVQLALASGLEASDWLQSLCQAVADGIDTKDTKKMGCMSCCLVLSPQKLLMCHEDLQSSFLRTLGSANVIEVTAVLEDPNIKTYCVLAFESHDTNVSSEQWVLHFNSELEKIRFIKALSDCWKNHFQVDVPVLPIEEFSLMKICQEMTFLLRDKLTVKKS